MIRHRESGVCSAGVKAQIARKELRSGGRAERLGRRSLQPLAFCGALEFRAGLGVGFGRGSVGLAIAFGFGGADFVGDGVAGALEGAPHVPGGYGAVRAPAFAEF